jgi:tRNA-dihydrouridine synthase
MNFWKELPKPFFILAPMEAVTDIIFREVIKTAAPPDVYFTEFTNATSWVNAGDKAIGNRLLKKDSEYPLVAQIWGANPEDIAKLAKHCKELGYHGIDINTGCPDKSAIKSGGGSALIKNPDLTAEIVAAAKESGLPVSLKTRLGYSQVSEYEEWITFLLGLNLEALTIHLRTKKEMSKVDAHWELMGPIVKMRDSCAPDTLIIGNGDVRNRQQGLELIKKTGCDGIMIGRGIFHNPYSFEKEPREHSREELLSLLTLQLQLFQDTSTIESRKFEPLKRFFKIYIRDFEGASELRHQLMQTKSIDEVCQILLTI